MQEHFDLIKEYHEEVKRRNLPPIKWRFAWNIMSNYSCRAAKRL
jgi:hypothetical protein